MKWGQCWPGCWNKRIHTGVHMETMSWSMIKICDNLRQKKNSPAREASTERCAKMEKEEHICQILIKGDVLDSLIQLLKFSGNLK